MSGNEVKECKSHKFSIYSIDFVSKETNKDTFWEYEVAYVVCERCGSVQKKKVIDLYTPEI